MLEEKELKLLMKAVEAVEFTSNKKEADLLAKVAGMENTDKLKRLRFADSLRSELMDLLHDERQISEEVCPPLSIDWQETCENNQDKASMAFIIREALELAFRAGYYYAMTDVGGSWQPHDRYDKEYIDSIGLEIVPPKMDFEDME